jgi:indolepyruvate ferredoxin oxidoreductase
MAVTRNETFSLTERYDALEGEVLVTGIQALARAPIDQMRSDRRAGLRTGAFISGYQGSPLGGFDRELLAHQVLLDEFGVILRPALNEELAATAVAGSQLVSTRPNARVDGVAGYWYGKAPGLERAGDAIRHANFVGTAPQGGVLALIGDDPACKSSTVPSRSDSLVDALGFALLEPGTMQDVLDLSRHGIEMSRACGLWVGLKIVTSVADGTGVANIDPDRIRPVVPKLERNGNDWRPMLSGFVSAPISLTQEAEIFGPRRELAERYISENQLNTEAISSEAAWLTIVATGYTGQVVLQALKTLGLDAEQASELGIRVLVLRGVLPFDSAALRRSARGVSTVLVVEEKRAYIETLVRDALYGAPDRPSVIGKRDGSGVALVSDSGALAADSLVEPLRRVLLTNISAERLAPKRTRILLNLTVSDDSVRTPYFCSGCPHNTSTVVPEGSLVGIGIGCHGMVSLVGNGNRGEFTGITQMGGEGTHWIGMAPFVETEHMFQNLGDGTFFHSGQLAVQAANAAGVNITYKLLYNAAVAMTGGQDATGILPVPQVAAKLIAEGVKEVVITTDDPAKYKGISLGRSVSVRHRDELVAVQERLRAIPGVTVLIHDQQCAAEKRRDRKRGILATPKTRIVIDHRVCEGCGDCGVQSNCLSLEPIDTEYGRKTRIDQASCNLDLSCIKGDCPAFVTVVPSKRPRTKRRGTNASESLPSPISRTPVEGLTIRMPGIGGTGVVTVSQILLTAAKIGGVEATSVDQTGLSQKAGPVVSTVTIGTPHAGRVHLLLGFDILTSVTQGNVEGLDPSWSHVIASSNVTPTGKMIGRVASANLDIGPYRAELDARSDAASNLYPNASQLTIGLLGSGVTANTFLLGVAYQAGFIPVPDTAIDRAIELNGTAVEANREAFAWGRRWVLDPRVVEQAARREAGTPVDQSGLDGLAEVGGAALVELVAGRRADLCAYQHRRYADRYVSVIDRVATAERAAGTDGSFTMAVAQQLYRVMAYKDEYEVARLLCGGGDRLEWALGSEIESRTWNLHPPMLRSMGMKSKLAFRPWTRPALAGLAVLRRVRGTPLDPFGRATVRREERQLIADYVALVDQQLLRLSDDPASATTIVGMVERVRGYEDVKMRNLAAYRTELTEAMAGLPSGKDVASDAHIQSR